MQGTGICQPQQGVWQCKGLALSLKVMEYGLQLIKCKTSSNFDYIDVKFFREGGHRKYDIEDGHAQSLTFVF